MKSLLGTFDFNEKQCLNMNKVTTGVFKHNYCTLVIDNRKIEGILWTYMHKIHVTHIEQLGFIS